MPLPTQLAPTCSQLGPDPAEPPSIPRRWARRHQGARASLHSPAPHPQPCRNRSPTEVLVQHTPRRWAASLPSSPIAPASQLCSPRPLAHPASAATAPEHPGRAPDTELRLPEHGLGNEHKLQPLARRKQKTQPCDAEQRCDQNQAPSPARARGAEPAGSLQPLPQTYLWRLRTPRQQLIAITPSARHGHAEPPRPR